MNDLTDEQLVENYRKGDIAALDFLIQRHLSPLYNFVFKYAHTIEETEDIAQETFLKAWKNLDKFYNKYKFKTWLYTIAKNTALDHLKKKNLIPFSQMETENAGNSFAETLISYEALPEEIMNQIDDVAMIGRAVNKLPLKYREIITMYYQDQLNFREISEKLRESINTIKTRHRRAITNLKRELFDK